MAQVNKAHLTPPKRRLIELMQDINFGRITNIPVRDGETLSEAEITDADYRLSLAIATLYRS